MPDAMARSGAIVRDKLASEDPALCKALVSLLVDRVEVGSDRVTICGSAAALEYDPPFNVPIAGHVSGLGKHKHREFAEAVGELTSPEFTNWLERGFRLAASWSREGSLHYWAMDWRHLLELTLAARAVYAESVNLCVWTKTSAGMGSFYRSQHELFAVWRNGRQRHRNNVQLGRFGRSRSNVWSYPGCTGGGEGAPRKRATFWPSTRR